MAGMRPAWLRRPAAALAWALWALSLLGLAVAVRLDQLLRQAGRPELASLHPSSVPLLVAAVSAATVQETMQPTSASLWLRPPRR